MVYKARLLLSGRQKIALVLLLVAIVAFLANYPRITEAILAFLLGGVVPGTNIVVPPDAVLLLVVAVFVIGTLALVLRMYFKAARNKRNFRIAVQSIHSEPVLPEPRDTVLAAESSYEPKAGAGVSVALHKRHAFSRIITSGLRRFSHVLIIAWTAADRAVQAVSGILDEELRLAGRWIWKGLSFAVEALYTLLVLLWYGIETAAKFIYQLSRKAAKLCAKGTRGAVLWTARIMRNSWQRSRPQLKRLDSWLEVRVHAFETGVRRRLGRYEAVRSVAAMSREYRKSVNELHPKAVLGVAHQKAGSMKKVIAARTHHNRPVKSVKG